MTTSESQKRKLRRSEVQSVLDAAELTVVQLGRMVDRLSRFTDHLDILAAERGGGAEGGSAGVASDEAGRKE